MGRFGLFRKFFEEATGYIEPNSEAVERLGETAPKHATYHKRIVVVSIIFGVVGVVAGICFLVSEWWSQHDGSKGGLWLAPIMFGAAGVLFGAAFACLFAPKEFMVGPMGQKWMTLIGTKNILAARIVCLVVALVPVAFAGVVMWFESRKRH